MFTKLFLIATLASLLAPVNLLAETWGDFEGAWSYNPTLVNGSGTIDRGAWSIHVDPHGVMTMTKDLSGMRGGYDARVDVTDYGVDGSFKVYNQYAPLDCDKMGTDIPASTNRFVFYLVWPAWSAGQVHLGPSNRDPNICTDPGGFHYYHYWKNIIGSPNYWTQFIADTHPQHTNLSGTCGDGIQPDWDCDDPPNEPRHPAGNTWGYIEGWQRNYIEFQFHVWADEQDWRDNYGGPYSVYLDQQEFYTTTLPDNTSTVNSKATAYDGNGNFRIHWQTDSNYLPNSDGTNRWGYEIRYSLTGEIQNQTDYDNATIVDDSANPYWDNGHTADGPYYAAFNIPGVSDYDTVYFALAEVRRRPSDGFDSWSFVITPFVRGTLKGKLQPGTGAVQPGTGAFQ